jgi:hypothetical protein
MSRHEEEARRAELTALVADLEVPPIGSSDRWRVLTDLHHDSGAPSSPTARSPWDPDETFDPERSMFVLPPTHAEWVARVFDELLDELDRLENETTEPGDGIEIDIDALLAPEPDVA